MTPEQNKVHQATGLSMDHLQAARHLEQQRWLSQEQIRAQFNTAQRASREWEVQQITRDGVTFNLIPNPRGVCGDCAFVFGHGLCPHEFGDGPDCKPGQRFDGRDMQWKVKQ